MCSFGGFSPRFTSTSFIFIACDFLHQICMERQLILKVTQIVSKMSAEFKRSEKGL